MIHRCTDSLEVLILSRSLVLMPIWCHDEEHEKGEGKGTNISLNRINGICSLKNIHLPHSVT